MRGGDLICFLACNAAVCLACVAVDTLVTILLINACLAFAVEGILVTTLLANFGAFALIRLWFRLL